MGWFVGWFLLVVVWVFFSCLVFNKLGWLVFIGVVFVFFVVYILMLGEWVIGGIEVKVVFYVFVIVGLVMIVCDRWDWVWLLLGVVVGFYVLVGGWVVIVGFCGWCCVVKGRMRFVKMFFWLVVGFVLFCLGLLFVLMLFVGLDLKLVLEVNEIYVME